MAAGVTAAAVAHGGEVGGRHRRYEHDNRRRRPGSAAWTAGEIGGEFGGIQVAVGVDQHAAKGKSMSGSRPLARSARAAPEPQAMVQPRCRGRC